MESSRHRWRTDRGRVLKDSDGAIIDSSLERGPNGFVLCRFCRRVAWSSFQILTLCFQETPSVFTTFCGESCVHEFKQQTQPQYLRENLFKRDKGVCHFCKRDCQLIYQKACKFFDVEDRKTYVSNLKDPLFFKKTSRCLADASLSFTSGMFWEAAHIIDVQDGGGSSKLDNFRTLCVPCHHRETMAKKILKKRSKKTELKQQATDAKTSILENQKHVELVNPTSKKLASHASTSRSRDRKLVQQLETNNNSAKTHKRAKDAQPSNPIENSRRHKFSQLEIDTLLVGIRKYGNQWAKIKQEYSTIFYLRSSVDLKDKARNLQKNKR